MSAQRRIMAVCIALVMTCWGCLAQWQPIASWPFVYPQFADAVIYTRAFQQVKTRANVHVGRNTAWYENNGKRMEMNKDVVTRIRFANGENYYMVEGQLCRVVREDSIDGQLCRLYYTTELDRDRFADMASRNSILSVLLADEDYSHHDEVPADSLRAAFKPEEVLPLTESYYMLYRGETFRASEQSIPRHLSKDDRRAFQKFIRSGEVIGGGRRPMENIWLRFFVK